MNLLEALRAGGPVIAAELRPPRAELAASEGMDAWIDTYHGVRSLTARGTFVFLTDSAVGSVEEDNLRHLVTNLGRDVPRDRIVPFVTCKHSLDYCLAYAARAWHHGFPALVVLGGDRQVGAPRCVPHAWELRRVIRHREPALALGGWANPYADAERQIDFLVAPDFTGEFFLTQAVTHHDLRPVERFLAAGRRRGLALPGLFGVFFYRSANPRTLAALRQFLPVPAEGLAAEFAAGAAAEEICARTLRALVGLGAQHFYISNLPLGRAHATLTAVLEQAGLGVRGSGLGVRG